MVGASPAPNGRRIADRIGKYRIAARSLTKRSPGCLPKLK
jgi:hypothetical protein